MEMYGTSDYFRLNEVYRVGAVDPVGMYVHPDKQEEEKQDKQRKRKAFRTPVKESKDEAKRNAYEELERRQAQSIGKRRADTANMPMSAFMLWGYMTAKNGQIAAIKEENPDLERQMEKYIAVQERAAMKFWGYEREAATFNAKA